MAGFNTFGVTGQDIEKSGIDKETERPVNTNALIPEWIKALI